jgi:hypothetical protein
MTVIEKEVESLNAPVGPAICSDPSNFQKWEGCLSSCQKVVQASRRCCAGDCFGASQGLLWQSGRSWALKAKVLLVEGSELKAWTEANRRAFEGRNLKPDMPLRES